MHYKTQFFLFIMIVSTSFISIKPSHSFTMVDKRTNQFKSTFLFFDSTQVAYFECNEFVSDALNNYSIETINHNFAGLLHSVKVAIVNKHDSAVIDTIYTFSNPANKIQIYKAKQNDFIFTFDVTDSLFNLIGDVNPGMTKDAFSQKFHITETINEKVQIANSEDSMRFMFYFEKGKLKRINSYLYLD